MGDHLALLLADGRARAVMRSGAPPRFSDTPSMTKGYGDERCSMLEFTRVEVAAARQPIDAPL